MNRGDFIWLMFLCGFSSLLLMPATHQVFVSLTQNHPYGMGFIKFAVLATMGELLAVRIVAGNWQQTIGMTYKAVIWGLLGMGIVLMFEIYLSGVMGAIKKELLFTGTGLWQAVLPALYISALMNLTFAPAFMAVHRLTDLYIDTKCQGQQPPGLSGLIAQIDWTGFIRFVVLKTIPCFWIPAHTVTFLLPPEYRVMAAAYLSVALGAILAYARRTPS
ncbi:hypothetical protein [Sporomusa sp. GT1]|uniref:hypothetical protein n=1 Tax=Sporomusa sp. GT1 TaxID=1534747 RepID=UPI001CB7FF0C|nr:hypothetical protein [Sporomusa sp. GT1]